MKHILNDIAQEEKNRILEQHSGGKKIDTTRFKFLLESKLGDAKPLISETENTEGVIKEQGPWAPGMGPKTDGKPTPSGVNPALKPDFDTMKRTGTDSDASNNKFWKELKPQLETLTGKKFTRKKQKTGGLFYGGVQEWEEDSMGHTGKWPDPGIPGVPMITYPLSAIDAGLGNDGNFIDIWINDPKKEVSLTGPCFDVSGNQAVASEPEGSLEKGYYSAQIKIWCKKEILDLVKSMYDTK